MSKLIKSKRFVPDELVFDILVQLPIKSISRFKCVCKSWYNLIQSQNFISMHCNNYTENILLIKRSNVVNNSNENIPRKYKSVFSFHSNDKSLTNLAPICEIPHFDGGLGEVLGPCNGIVCVTDYSRIVLCNPATREFKLLPPSSYQSSDQVLCCNKGVGFGVDSDSIDCDFKVVRILRLLDRITNDGSRYPGYRAELYSLRANSWRRLDYVLPYIEYCRSFEIFFNGACHWYACNRKYVILSFNVNSEVFEEIDIPSNYLPMTGQIECLQILNGSLTFVSYTTDVMRSEQNNIDIWAMKEYGVAESWLKLFHIELPHIRYPLSIWMDNFLFLENDLGELELCELDSPYREKFQISGDRGSMRVLVYKKTLVSINK